MKNTRDRNQSEDLRNKSVDKSVDSESTRRSGSEDFGSSSGRSNPSDRSESIDRSRNRSTSEPMESGNVGRKSSQDEH